MITCLLLHDKHQRELQEKQAIQQLMEEALAQEHQVDEVQESYVEIKTPEMLTKILPMSDEFYECQMTFARVLHCENSNEVDGEEATWCVAGEILERVYDEEFPNTIEEVIYQKGQFECTWNGMLYNEDPTDVEIEIAAEAMQLYMKGGRILPEGVVYGAEFEQGSGVYKKIRNTYFCYK